MTDKGEHMDWWIWDGERQSRIEKLTPEQRKLPIRSIWNDTLLVRRFENEWTPETDFRYL